VIVVTEGAATQIQRLLTSREMPGGGLRVGVKAGGCSGFEYVFEWEAGPRENDLVFSGPGGARVWVDPRSHRILDGTTLDYDANLLTRGFVFQNPRARSTCGCGTSFSM
jgi:iron-sulfur cluster assembly protein